MLLKKITDKKHLSFALKVSILGLTHISMSRVTIIIMVGIQLVHEDCKLSAETYTSQKTMSMGTTRISQGESEEIEMEWIDFLHILHMTFK